MIKKVKTNEGIQYKKLSPEEMKARGILGRLIGPCADFNNATRNGRKYSEQLWENVFNDPIMQEKIKNGVCFGELGHPEDRTEIDMEKIAVCLREQPVKNEKGQLCAVFDILDTPNGRILKTLCDYGSTVGVSSRGQGDIITDINGDEAVDPDTYECECWDIVLVPAVESARMQYVKEDLDTNALKMKKALTESLKNATEEDKKVMEKTLKELNIKLDEDAIMNKNDSIGRVDNRQINKPEEKEAPTIPNPTDAVTEGAIDGLIPNVDFGGVNINVDASGQNNAAGFGGSQPKVESCENCEGEECKEGIGSAITGLTKDIPILNTILASDEAEKADQEDTTEEPEIDELDLPVNPEEAPIEEPIDEVPEEDVPTEAQAEEEPVEEPVDERTDEEIFFDYLKANFDEKQIKKACKALDIEIPEEEEVETEEETVEEEQPAEEEIPAEEEQESNDENREDKEEEAKEVVEEAATAINDGDAALLKSLQEALKGKSDLEGSVKSLQEKLAVSDTKVNELTEENNNYKKAIARLATMSKSNKDLKESVTKLEESLKEKDAIIEENKSRIARLVKSRKESVSESASLNESIETKKSEITTLTENLNKSQDEVKTLTEKLSNSDNKVSELNESLQKSKALKEAYQKLANKAVNKYIDIKATTLGLTSADIKRKLGESYTLDDVDQVCEDLKAYQLNVSKLPFSIDRKVGVRVNEGTSKINSRTKQFDDDDVDDTLIKLAKL